jgi:hypothetical protein
MTGTDLGISYQRDDKLFFLFGDSWTKTKPSDRNNSNTDRDALAWTDVAQPDGVPYLNWERRQTNDPTNGQFLPLRVDGVPDGAMSVPVEGVPNGDDTYFFFYVTDFLGRASSVLAHAVDDNFAALVRDHQVQNSLFQSVSTVTIGDELWIYGAGQYRGSKVHLARAKLATLQNRASWTYYNRPDTYLQKESNAKPLPLPLEEGDQEDCVGELSVRKHPTQDLYFMAYNCDRVQGSDNIPHHIRLRVARAPEGPWSAPLTMLEDHAFDGQVPLEASRGDARAVSDPRMVHGPWARRGRDRVHALDLEPVPGAARAYAAADHRRGGTGRTTFVVDSRPAQSHSCSREHRNPDRSATGRDDSALGGRRGRCR